MINQKDDNTHSVKTFPDHKKKKKQKSLCKPDALSVESHSKDIGIRCPEKVSTRERLSINFKKKDHTNVNSENAGISRNEVLCESDNENPGNCSSSEQGVRSQESGSGSRTPPKKRKFSFQIFKSLFKKQKSRKSKDVPKAAPTIGSNVDEAKASNSSETEERNLTMAIRLPPEADSLKASNLRIEAETVQRNETEATNNMSENEVCLKCCGITPTRATFQGSVRVPPGTCIRDLIEMPLYILSPDEKIKRDSEIDLKSSPNIIKPSVIIKMKKQDQSSPIGCLNLNVYFESKTTPDVLPSPSSDQNKDENVYQFRPLKCCILRTLLPRTLKECIKRNESCAEALMTLLENKSLLEDTFTQYSAVWSSNKETSSQCMSPEDFVRSAKKPSDASPCVTDSEECSSPSSAQFYANDSKQTVKQGKSVNSVDSVWPQSSTSNEETGASENSVSSTEMTDKVPSNTPISFTNSKSNTSTNMTTDTNIQMQTEEPDFESSKSDVYNEEHVKGNSRSEERLPFLCGRTAPLKERDKPWISSASIVTDPETEVSPNANESDSSEKESSDDETLTLLEGARSKLIKYLEEGNLETTNEDKNVNTEFTSNKYVGFSNTVSCYYATPMKSTSYPSPEVSERTKSKHSFKTEANTNREEVPTRKFEHTENSTEKKAVQDETDSSFSLSKSVSAESENTVCDLNSNRQEAGPTEESGQRQNSTNEHFQASELTGKCNRAEERALTTLEEITNGGKGESNHLTDWVERINNMIDTIKQDMEEAKEYEYIQNELLRDLGRDGEALNADSSDIISDSCQLKSQTDSTSNTAHRDANFIKKSVNENETDLMDYESQESRLEEEIRENIDSLIGLIQNNLDFSTHHEVCNLQREINNIREDENKKRSSEMHNAVNEYFESEEYENVITKKIEIFKDVHNKEQEETQTSTNNITSNSINRKEDTFTIETSSVTLKEAVDSGVLIEPTDSFESNSRIENEREILSTDLSVSENDSNTSEYEYKIRQDTDVLIQTREQQSYHRQTDLHDHKDILKREIDSLERKQDEVQNIPSEINSDSKNKEINAFNQEHFPETPKEDFDKGINELNKVMVYFSEINFGTENNPGNVPHNESPPETLEDNLVGSTTVQHSESNSSHETLEENFEGTITEGSVVNTSLQDITSSSENKLEKKPGDESPRETEEEDHETHVTERNNKNEVTFSSESNLEDVSNDERRVEILDDVDGNMTERNTDVNYLTEICCNPVYEVKQMSSEKLHKPLEENHNEDLTERSNDINSFNEISFTSESKLEEIPNNECSRETLKENFLKDTTEQNNDVGFFDDVCFNFEHKERRCETSEENFERDTFEPSYDTNTFNEVSFSLESKQERISNEYSHERLEEPISSHSELDTTIHNEHLCETLNGNCEKDAIEQNNDIASFNEVSSDSESRLEKIINECSREVLEDNFEGNMIERNKVIDPLNKTCSNSNSELDNMMHNVYPHETLKENFGRNVTEQNDDTNLLTEIDPDSECNLENLTNQFTFGTVEENFGEDIIQANNNVNSFKEICSNFKDKPEETTNESYHEEHFERKMAERSDDINYRSDITSDFKRKVEEMSNNGLKKENFQNEGSSSDRKCRDHLEVTSNTSLASDTARTSERFLESEIRKEVHFEGEAMKVVENNGFVTYGREEILSTVREVEEDNSNEIRNENGSMYRSSQTTMNETPSTNESIDSIKTRDNIDLLVGYESKTEFETISNTFLTFTNINSISSISQVKMVGNNEFNREVSTENDSDEDETQDYQDQNVENTISITLDSDSVVIGESFKDTNDCSTWQTAGGTIVLGNEYEKSEQEEEEGCNSFQGNSSVKVTETDDEEDSEYETKEDTINLEKEIDIYEENDRTTEIVRDNHDTEPPYEKDNDLEVQPHVIKDEKQYNEENAIAIASNDTNFKNCEENIKIDEESNENEGLEIVSGDECKSEEIKIAPAKEDSQSYQEGTENTPTIDENEKTEICDENTKHVEILGVFLANEENRCSDRNGTTCEAYEENEKDEIMKSEKTLDLDIGVTEDFVENKENTNKNITVTEENAKVHSQTTSDNEQTGHEEQKCSHSTISNENSRDGEKEHFDYQKVTENEEAFEIICIENNETEGKGSLQVKEMNLPFEESYELGRNGKNGISQPISYLTSEKQNECNQLREADSNNGAETVEKVSDTNAVQHITNEDNVALNDKLFSETVPENEYAACNKENHTSSENVSPENIESRRNENNSDENNEVNDQTSSHPECEDVNICHINKICEDLESKSQFQEVEEPESATSESITTKGDSRVLSKPQMEGSSSYSSNNEINVPNLFQDNEAHENKFDKSDSKVLGSAARVEESGNTEGSEKKKTETLRSKEIEQDLRTKADDLINGVLLKVRLKVPDKKEGHSQAKGNEEEKQEGKGVSYQTSESTVSLKMESETNHVNEDTGYNNVPQPNQNVTETLYSDTNNEEDIHSENICYENVHTEEGERHFDDKDSDKDRSYLFEDADEDSCSLNKPSEVQEEEIVPNIQPKDLEEVKSDTANEIYGEVLEGSHVQVKNVTPAFLETQTNIENAMHSKPNDNMQYEDSASEDKIMKDEAFYNDPHATTSKASESDIDLDRQEVEQFLQRCLRSIPIEESTATAESKKAETKQNDPNTASSIIRKYEMMKNETQNDSHISNNKPLTVCINKDEEALLHERSARAEDEVVNSGIQNSSYPNTSDADVNESLMVCVNENRKDLMFEQSARTQDEMVKNDTINSPDTSNSAANVNQSLMICVNEDEGALLHERSARAEDEAVNSGIQNNSYPNTSDADVNESLMVCVDENRKGLMFEQSARTQDEMVKNDTINSPDTSNSAADVNQPLMICVNEDEGALMQKHSARSEDETMKGDIQNSSYTSNSATDVNQPLMICVNKDEGALMQEQSARTQDETVKSDIQNSSYTSNNVADVNEPLMMCVNEEEETSIHEQTARNDSHHNDSVADFNEPLMMCVNKEEEALMHQQSVRTENEVVKSDVEDSSCTSNNVADVNEPLTMCISKEEEVLIHEQTSNTEDESVKSDIQSNSHNSDTDADVNEPLVMYVNKEEEALMHQQSVRTENEMVKSDVEDSSCTSNSVADVNKPLTMCISKEEEVLIHEQTSNTEDESVKSDIQSNSHNSDTDADVNEPLVMCVNNEEEALMHQQSVRTENEMVKSDVEDSSCTSNSVADVNKPLTMCTSKEEEVLIHEQTSNTEDESVKSDIQSNSHNSDTDADVNEPLVMCVNKNEEALMHEQTSRIEDESARNDIQSNSHNSNTAADINESSMICVNRDEEVLMHEESARLDDEAVKHDTQSDSHTSSSIADVNKPLMVYVNKEGEALMHEQSSKTENTIEESDIQSNNVLHVEESLTICANKDEETVIHEPSSGIENEAVKSDIQSYPHTSISATSVDEPSTICVNKEEEVLMPQQSARKENETMKGDTQNDSYTTNVCVDVPLMTCVNKHEEALMHGHSTKTVDETKSETESDFHTNNSVVDVNKPLMICVSTDEQALMHEVEKYDTQGGSYTNNCIGDVSKHLMICVNEDQEASTYEKSATTKDETVRGDTQNDSPNSNAAADVSEPLMISTDIEEDTLMEEQSARIEDEVVKNDTESDYHSSNTVAVVNEPFVVCSNELEETVMHEQSSKTEITETKDHIYEEADTLLRSDWEDEQEIFRSLAHMDIFNDQSETMAFCEQFFTECEQENLESCSSVLVPSTLNTVYKQDEDLGSNEECGILDDDNASLRLEKTETDNINSANDVTISDTKGDDKAIEIEEVNNVQRQEEDGKCTESKTESNVDTEPTSSNNQLAIPNKKHETLIPKPRTDEIQKTYAIVQNDIQKIITELLRSSQEIKNEAILNGVSEEEPFFSYKYLIDKKPSSEELYQQAIKSCTNGNDESNKINDVTSSESKEKGKSHKSLDKTSISGPRELNRALRVTCYNSHRDQVQLSVGDIHSENINTKFKVCLNELLIRGNPLNALSSNRNNSTLINSDNRVVSVTHKHDMIPSRTVFFCSSKSLHSKIPKTSYIFGKKSKNEDSVLTKVTCFSANWTEQQSHTVDRCKPKENIAITGEKVIDKSEQSQLCNRISANDPNNSDDCDMTTTNSEFSNDSEMDSKFAVVGNIACDSSPDHTHYSFNNDSIIHMQENTCNEGDNDTCDQRTPDAEENATTKDEEDATTKYEQNQSKDTSEENQPSIQKSPKFQIINTAVMQPKTLQKVSSSCKHIPENEEKIVAVDAEPSSQDRLSDESTLTSATQEHFLKGVSAIPTKNVDMESKRMFPVSAKNVVEESSTTKLGSITVTSKVTASADNENVLEIRSKQSLLSSDSEGTAKPKAPTVNSANAILNEETGAKLKLSSAVTRIKTIEGENSGPSSSRGVTDLNDAIHGSNEENNQNDNQEDLNATESEGGSVNITDIYKNQDQNVLSDPNIPRTEDCDDKKPVADVSSNDSLKPKEANEFENVPCSYELIKNKGLSKRTDSKKENIDDETTRLENINASTSKCPEDDLQKEAAVVDGERNKNKRNSASDSYCSTDTKDSDYDADVDETSLDGFRK